MPEFLVVVPVFLVLALSTLALISIAWDMAKARGLNPLLWCLMSFLWSPFGTYLILWLFYEKLLSSEEEAALAYPELPKSKGKS